MKLKCIGGPNDGEIHDVPNHLGIGDWFKIQQLPELSALDYKMDCAPPECMKIEINIYRIICLRFPEPNSKMTLNKIMLFLVPKDWSDKQAIEWQFAK